MVVDQIAPNSVQRAHALSFLACLLHPRLPVADWRCLRHSLSLGGKAEIEVLNNPKAEQIQVLQTAHRILLRRQLRVKKSEIQRVLSVLNALKANHIFRIGKRLMRPSTLHALK